RDTKTKAWFLEMAYYPAGDLHHYFGSNPLSLGQALSITADLIAALAAAHAMSHLHRDVKPRNILVDTTDRGRPRPVLADWGIARVIRGFNLEYSDPHLPIGTRIWAPIEQLDQRVRAEYGIPESKDRHPWFTPDLWSVGAVLYWLITAEPPRLRREIEAGMNDSPLPGEYVNWLFTDRPEPQRLDEMFPGIPVELADLVAQWLSNDPRKRTNADPADGKAVMPQALAAIDFIAAKHRRLDRLSVHPPVPQGMFQQQQQQQ
ncbi:protein kinase, partial [Nocardia salmonicida]|uniref:protein kinase domain-containing protein n=1 Tax=Nocardia salmonicida TaxID=53431 RepID=UPI0036488D37